MNKRRKNLIPDKVWRVSERPSTIRRPEDSREILKVAFPSDSREHFVVVFLDARHKPMAPAHEVSVGSLNASLVHPREIFGPAMAVRAAAILVAHNHPSGDTRPSGDDLELTGRLDKAGDLLGIALLDHIVVSVGDIHGDEPMEILSIREYGWPSKANDD